MKATLRLSPIHDYLQSLKGNWCDINGMPTLVELEQNYATCLGIADRSCLTRFGVKGANAAQWLLSQDLPIPERPNSWLPLAEGGIIARLGLTEFLIEDSLNSAIAAQLSKACQSPPAKVYPVLRQDLALVLVGDRVPDLLRETCSFNFQEINICDRPVVLTSMIGVSVMIVPDERDNRPYYRVWCDGTFGRYFWKTIVEIAAELGGGAIGSDIVL